MLHLTHGISIRIFPYKTIRVPLKSAIEKISPEATVLTRRSQATAQTSSLCTRLLLAVGCWLLPAGRGSHDSLLLASFNPSIRVLNLNCSGPNANPWSPSNVHDVRLWTIMWSKSPSILGDLAHAIRFYMYTSTQDCRKETDEVYIILNNYLSW